MIRMWLPGKSNQMIVIRLDWKMSLSIHRIYLHVKSFILHDSYLSATHRTKTCKGNSVWCHMLSLHNLIIIIIPWYSIKFFGWSGCVYPKIEALLVLNCISHIFPYFFFNKFYKYEELFSQLKRCTCMWIFTNIQLY